MAQRRKRPDQELSESTRHISTDFGAFYPTGYIVVAIPGKSQATRIRKDLLTGGYDERDVIHFDAQSMARSLHANLENAGFMARLGMTKKTLEHQLALAREGCDFLLVHAMTDDETARVVRVIRRVPVRLAQRFHRFAIEDLDLASA